MIAPEGSLLEHPLPELLRDIYEAQGNGCLTISLAGKKKELFFANGYLTYASSTFIEDRLDRYLQRIGRLTDEQLEESERLYEGSGKRKGTILIEMGALSGKDLFDLLKMQIKAMVIGLFAWRSGHFSFTPNANLSSEIVSLKTTTAQLILEGFRGMPDISPWLPLLQGGSIVPAWSDNTFLRYQKIVPLEWELSVARMIDGQRSVKDLVAATRMPEEAVWRTVLAFHAAGMVTLPSSRSATRQETPVATEKDAPPEIAPAGDAETRKKFLEEYLRLKKLDYYQVLGLERSADSTAVKKAFLQMARRFHPDRYFSSPLGDLQELLNEIFSLINEAWETLKDPDLRRKYDQRQASSRVEEKGHGKPDDRTVAKQQFQRAREALSAGDPAAAVEALRWASRLDPDQAQYHAWLGIALVRSERGLHEAEDHLKTAISLDAGVADYHYYLGRVYATGGLPRRAAEFYSRALSLNPGHLKAAEGIKAVSGEEEKKRSRFKAKE
jgi:hypothetical protein